jgi:PAS domain-containing protein
LAFTHYFAARERRGRLAAGGEANPMPWAWDDEGFIAATVPETATTDLDDADTERERRHTARSFFRAAPPYCIEFDSEGAAMLCQKAYEYWPDREPEDATTWRPISRHKNLEEAERRLRLICGGPVYYDAEGRVLSKGPTRRPQWDMPPTDDD